MSSSSSSSTPLPQPKMTKDPRFRAARKLIESGRDGAIDMFATLLEEARTKYGEASIETAPAYFEYGVALFRESQRQQEAQTTEEEEGDDDGGDDSDDKKPAAVEEKEPESSKSKNEKSEEEPGKQQTKDDNENNEDGEDNDNDNNNEEDEQQQPDEEEEEEEDDLELAFSMMETAFAVYDNYVQLAKSSSSAKSDYLEWSEREQLPRILSNIGDLLSVMDRHADAADAYTRELAFRDSNLARYEKESEKDMSTKIQELKDRRKCVEANVLVATELLACEPGQDVITTETKSCLVKANEREDYATGYYEQARDQLQETVYLMAKLISTAKSDNEKQELKQEKENICFASTLVMGVGEQLALLKEKNAEKEEPAKKKPKR